jgi:hypothetical protein
LSTVCDLSCGQPSQCQQYEIAFEEEKDPIPPVSVHSEPDILSLVNSTELDGTLQWLIEAPEGHSHPISEEDAQKHREYSFKYLEELRPVLEELGLQLPESFTRLMLDSRLQDKVVSLGDNYWRLPRRVNGLPRIWKVPPKLYKLESCNQAAAGKGKKDENVRRGYLYPIGWDQQCDVVYTSLYLDTGDSENPRSNCVFDGKCMYW